MSAQRNATITPSNASNKTLKWTYTDSSVATVNSSGLVTAKKAGTTYIRATIAISKKNWKKNLLSFSLRHERQQINSNLFLK